MLTSDKNTSSVLVTYGNTTLTRNLSITCSSEKKFDKQLKHLTKVKNSSNSKNRKILGVKVDIVNIFCERKPNVMSASETWHITQDKAKTVSRKIQKVTVVKKMKLYKINNKFKASKVETVQVI